MMMMMKVLPKQIDRNDLQSNGWSIFINFSLDNGYETLHLFVDSLC